MPSANVFTLNQRLATLFRFLRLMQSELRMDTSNTEKPDEASSCDACPGCGHSHEMPCNVSGGLAGWPLAIAAFFVFVLPVGMAIAGAVLIGRDPNRQLLGALAGFAVGVLLAAVVGRILRRRTKHHEEG